MFKTTRKVGKPQALVVHSVVELVPLAKRLQPQRLASLAPNQPHRPHQPLAPPQPLPPIHSEEVHLGPRLRLRQRLALVSLEVEAPSGLPLLNQPHRLAHSVQVLSDSKQHRHLRLVCSVRLGEQARSVILKPQSLHLEDLVGVIALSPLCCIVALTCRLGAAAGTTTNLFGNNTGGFGAQNTQNTPQQNTGLFGNTTNTTTPNPNPFGGGTGFGTF